MHNSAHRVGAVIVRFLFAGLLCFPVMAKSEDAIPKPIIQVENPVFSFGSVPQGTLVKHDFVVKNSGTMNLVIQKAVAGCGCTAALPPSGPIAPGQSAPISVTFDTSGFEGDKEKTVQVFSNDIDSPQPTLTLKGYIETPLTIDPVRLSFGRVMQGQPGDPKHVSIKLHEGVRASIKQISTFAKGLSVETKSNDGKTAAAIVNVLPTAGSGELRDRVLVTIEYADKREQTYNIPVVGMVEAGVVIQPSSISVGVIEGVEPIIKTAKVVSSAKDPISITSIQSDDPAVHASFKPLKDGKVYGITISVDPKAVTKDLRSTVTIVTTSKEQAPLVLNVYGIIPPKQ